jgi:FSR family fosmidomycin resistance protein-like MFS transporter
MVIPRSRLFWSVSISHLVIDTFNASVPVILTFLSGTILRLSNTEIGLAVSLYQFLSALSQPFAGWLADRTGGRWLGAGGVAWTVSLQTLALVLAMTTGQYILFVIPLVLAALGSGAFHPVGTMHAAGRARRASGDMAIFFMMGQMGGAIGPALTGALLDGAATHYGVFTASLGESLSGRLVENASVLPMLALALAAIPSILFMSMTVPDAQTHRAGRATEAKGTARAAWAIAPLLLLAGVVMLRGMVNPGLAAFLPRLFQSYGWSPAEYGLISSLYWLSGGLAGLVAGQLADRFGARIVIAITLIATAPMVAALGLTNSAAAFALAVLVGGLSGSSHSLIVAQTHRYMPGGKGLASGAGLGFIFGMGALGTLVIGALSDALGGIPQAFQVVAVVTGITGLLALLLPNDRPS